MALRSMSTADLRRELARRERGSARLVARRDKLAKQLAALEAELADLGAQIARPGRKPGRPAGRRGPGRPKGSRNRGGLTLLGAILKGVKAGATVSPAEAAVAAKRAGYKSSSQHFGMMVANTLAKASEFKKLGRGQYQLKGGAGAAKTAGKRGRKPGKAKARKAKAGRAKAAPSRKAPAPSAAGHAEAAAG